MLRTSQITANELRKLAKSLLSRAPFQQFEYTQVKALAINTGKMIHKPTPQKTNNATSEMLNKPILKNKALKIKKANYLECFLFFVFLLCTSRVTLLWF